MKPLKTFMRGLVGIMLTIMLMSATSKNQFATFIKLIKKNFYGIANSKWGLQIKSANQHDNA